MADIIKAIIDPNNLPAVLVLAGLAFLLLAIVGEIQGKVKVPAERQKLAGGIGVVLLGVGLVLYVAHPASPNVASVVATPSVVATKVQTSNPSPVPTMNLSPSSVDPIALLTTARNWPVVLKDSFDNNANGWPTGDDKNYPSTTRQIANGKYRWEFQPTEQSNWSWAYVPVDLAADLMLTAQVGGFDRVGSNGLTMYALGIRDGKLGFYLFEIANTGKFNFSINGSKSEYLLIPAISGSLNLQGENNFAIIAQGTQFYLYINNTFVGKTDDNSLDAGKVALAVYLPTGQDKGIFEFDNFELRRKP